MKTMTIPTVRVEPALRDEMESLLADGETLSQFVESSVRAAVQQRRQQAEFVARGLRSLDESRSTGHWVEAETVMARLQAKLDAARTLAATRKR